MADRTLTFEQAQAWVTARMNAAQGPAREAWQTISTNLRAYYDAGKNLVVKEGERVDIAAFQEWANGAATNIKDSVTSAISTLRTAGTNIFTRAAGGAGDFLGDAWDWIKGNAGILGGVAAGGLLASMLGLFEGGLFSLQGILGIALAGIVAVAGSFLIDGPEGMGHRAVDGITGGRSRERSNVIVPSQIRGHSVVVAGPAAGAAADAVGAEARIHIAPDGQVATTAGPNDMIITGNRNGNNQFLISEISFIRNGQRVHEKFTGAQRPALPVHSDGTIHFEDQATRTAVTSMTEALATKSNTIQIQNVAAAQRPANVPGTEDFYRVRVDNTTVMVSRVAGKWTATHVIMNGGTPPTDTYIPLAAPVQIADVSGTQPLTLEILNANRAKVTEAAAAGRTAAGAGHERAPGDNNGTRGLHLSRVTPTPAPGEAPAVANPTAALAAAMSRGTTTPAQIPDNFDGVNQNAALPTIVATGPGGGRSGPVT